MKHSMELMVALPLAALAACSPRDLSRVEARRAHALIASGRPLVWAGGKPILPAWKTDAERASERLAKNAAALGLPFADQYDTYRQTNISKFFITTPPTTSGFRPVAEFEPSQAYLVAWQQGLPPAVNTYFQSMLKGAWGKVPVLLAHASAAHKTWLEAQLVNGGISTAELTDPSKVVWWQTSNDAIWSRDYGPISIVTTDAAQKLSFVDFRYYHQRVHDDQIPAELAASWGVNDFRPDLDFEGGNFMNTTDGLCVTSKVVLQVNTQFTQAAVEDLFKKYVACKKTIFTTQVIGDGTGHIDIYTKLGSDTTAIMAQYTPAQDAASPGKGKNVTILDQDAALLAATPTPSGKTIAVTRIPMASWGQDSYGWYVRTYVNSVSLQGASSKTVIVPVYSDEASQESAAMAAYATVFPGWTLVKVDSKSIISWGGAIHCVTMQIAAGAKAKMEADPAGLCGTSQLTCTTPVGCGSVTAAGCCDGAQLKYCDSGQLVVQDCTADPSCGWNAAQKFYDCATAGGADPAGTPKACAPSTTGDLGAKLDKTAVQPDKPIAKADRPPPQPDRAPSTDQPPRPDSLLAEGPVESPDQARPGADGAEPEPVEPAKGCACGVGGQPDDASLLVELLLGLVCLLGRRVSRATRRTGCRE